MLTRRGHQSGEPEITELDDAELRDEDVLGLHVAVDDLKVSFSNEPIPIACPILLFSLFTSAFLPSFSQRVSTYFVLSVTPIKTLY